MFLFAIAVGGCASFWGSPVTPTPYQPSGYSGGYEDQRIGPAAFIVSVRGNGVTSETTLVGYFHRRANELCQGIGYGGYSYKFDTQTTQTETSPRTVTVDKTYDGNTTHKTIQEHPATYIQKYVVTGSVNCNTSIPAAPTWNAPPPALSLQQAQAAFPRLTHGLTREQVVQILGPPTIAKTGTAGEDTGRPWLALKWNYVWNGGTPDEKGLGLLFSDQGGWRLAYWAWY